MGFNFRELVAGCRIVMLCATALEAEPVLRTLIKQRRVTVAAKEVIVGELTVGVGPSCVHLPSSEANILLSGRHESLSARDLMCHSETNVTPSAVFHDLADCRVVVAVTGCDKSNVAHLLTCLLQTMDPLPSLVLQFGIAGALPATENLDSFADLCAAEVQTERSEYLAEFGFRTATNGVVHLLDLALATAEIYADTGSSSIEGWLSMEDLGFPLAELGDTKLYNYFPLDKKIVMAAAEILTELESGCRLVVGPFITVSRISGLRREGEELAARWGAVAESMEGATAAHMCALYEVPFLEVRGISNMVDDRNRSTWQVSEAIEVAGTAALALCRASMHDSRLSSLLSAEYLLPGRT